MDNAGAFWSMVGTMPTDDVGTVVSTITGSTQERLHDLVGLSQGVGFTACRLDRGGRSWPMSVTGRDGAQWKAEINPGAWTEGTLRELLTAISNLERAV